MAFKTFNRALYAKIESAEGTLNAPVDATDYIETTDPTFTVTNRMFDRNPTRMSITPAPTGSAVLGRVVSDTFQSDSTVYYVQGVGGGSNSGAANNDGVCGEVTNGVPLLTADAASETDVGFAYAPLSTNVLGGANSSSLSMRLVYDVTSGAYIEAVGCRGSVEFAMTNGDRVLMNFTFTGRMSNYTATGTSNDAPQIAATTVPPAFVGVSLGIQDTSYAANSAADYTGSIFSTMNINLGNEMAVRESSSAASGYDVAYITGRTPTATFNPDAVLEATFPFWDQFLAGDVTRAKLTVGATAGNKFMMKMPAMQFTGIADGNRDEVFVYDSSTNLTGGDYGSSIQQSASAAAAASTQTNPRLGTNNEFVLFCI